jgi:hypothetical protein
VRMEHEHLYMIQVIRPETRRSCLFLHSFLRETLWPWDMAYVRETQTLNRNFASFSSAQDFGLQTKDAPAFGIADSFHWNSLKYLHPVTTLNPKP